MAERRYLNPGRPFWTGFTAFFVTLTTLLGLDAAGAITVDRSWLGASVCALVLALAEYGREQLARQDRG